MPKDTIAEMIAAKQAPGAHVFRERVVNNISDEPVLVTSSAQHKELQRQANATWIGDDGMKELKERVDDRRSDQRKRAAEDAKNG